MVPPSNVEALVGFAEQRQRLPRLVGLESEQVEDVERRLVGGVAMLTSSSLAEHSRRTVSRVDQTAQAGDIGSLASAAPAPTIQISPSMSELFSSSLASMCMRKKFILKEMNCLLCVSFCVIFCASVVQIHGAFLNYIAT